MATTKSKLAAASHYVFPFCAPCARISKGLFCRRYRWDLGYQMHLPTLSTQHRTNCTGCIDHFEPCPRDDKAKYTTLWEPSASGLGSWSCLLPYW